MNKYGANYLPVREVTSNLYPMLGGVRLPKAEDSYEKQPIGITMSAEQARQFRAGARYTVQLPGAGNVMVNGLCAERRDLEDGRVAVVFSTYERIARYDR
jgi:hypothetical protein